MEIRTLSEDEMNEIKAPKRRGRPPGSKNKVVTDKPVKIVKTGGKRGRPKGSKNVRKNVDFKAVDISAGKKYYVKKRGSIIGGPYDSWLRAQDAVLDMVCSGAAGVVYDIVGDE